MNQDVLDIKYEKYELENGLEVILYENRAVPIAGVNLWYRVGSANEKQGKTGFAHLFEHMMFQGSANVPKEKHFKYIEEAGGSLNGSTSFDRTNYYETFPPNYLELALWLESDRMGHLLPALTEEKVQNQKEVVMNERKERYDNQPYGRAWELIFSNLYPSSHPYNWPIIGWMEDIKAFNIDDVKSFFQTYYAPNNASLVVGGNIDIVKTKKLIQDYFGDIQPGKGIPEIIIPENVSLLPNKIIHEDDVQLPRLYLCWRTDKLYGKDDANLDLLSDILSGAKNSILYKKLIHEQQTALEIFSFQHSARLSGAFIIIGVPKPGVTLDELKESILNLIHTVIEEGISEEEIVRSKNGIKAGYIFSLQKLSKMLDYLNNYNTNLQEPNSFIFDLNRYQKVNCEDLRVTAKKYLNEKYFELHIVPKKGRTDD